MKRALRIPARFMRGGTSKGLFFLADDLPAPGRRRDQLLFRAMGSPDPFGKQIDGMGGATSSTSKIIVAGPAKKPDHDVEYLFGQVSIKDKFIDYSGNCGNLTAAVGQFAIESGFVAQVPQNGICTVRMWQQNIGKTILAHVPIADGQVQEAGDLHLAGVAFPGAAIKLDFLSPSDAAVLPTGNPIDTLDIPGVGKLDVSLVNSAIPMVFVRATDLGYKGTELQSVIDSDPSALAKLELIRAHGAYKMGLVKSIEDAQFRQHSPKLALVSEPQDYIATNGEQVKCSDINLTARAMSMGRMHHAFMGTGAVAIATAAAIPGTIVESLRTGNGALKFGHPAGMLEVGVQVEEKDGLWVVNKAVMNRTARTLMDGYVHVPSTVPGTGA